MIAHYTVCSGVGPGSWGPRVGLGFYGFCSEMYVDNAEVNYHMTQTSHLELQLGKWNL